MQQFGALTASGILANGALVLRSAAHDLASGRVVSPTRRQRRTLARGSSVDRGHPARASVSVCSSSWQRRREFRSSASRTRGSGTSPDDPLIRAERRFRRVVLGSIASTSRWRLPGLFYTPERRTDGARRGDCRANAEYDSRLTYHATRRDRPGVIVRRLSSSRRSGRRSVPSPSSENRLYAGSSPGGDALRTASCATPTTTARWLRASRRAPAGARRDVRRTGALQR
jgi:hypothetical protein